VSSCIMLLIRMLSLLAIITKVHSFSWQILPNSVGQLAKFCDSLQQNHQSAICQVTLFCATLRWLLVGLGSTVLDSLVFFCDIL